jgi:ubiquinone/menaquinone biosynthesis C-methylase UbiE
MQERVTFHAASALALPFADNSFDGAWSLQMNMNVENKLSWLNEVCRVLRPGGRAVFSRPLGAGQFDEFSGAAGNFPRCHHRGRF